MLQVNNIEVIYDKAILVLKGMSLSVPEGKIVALLGSNGAGKSTTLKAISGLLKAEEGEVTDGARFARLPACPAARLQIVYRRRLPRPLPL